MNEEQFKEFLEDAIKKSFAKTPDEHYMDDAIKGGGRALAVGIYEYFQWELPDVLKEETTEV